MSVNFPAVEGVLVLCPGCNAEVPATDGPIDQERPFRCSRCRNALTDFATRVLDSAEREGPKSGKRKQSNKDVPNQPVTVGGGGDGNRNPQPAIDT